jgi:16S rRNA (cytosine1402-N4)-methyltransferase
LEAFGHGVPVGILADLGVSSFQFDSPERGFSFRFDERLDMRMNKDAVLDACDLLNTYDKDQLENIFSQFGDFKAVESKRLASNIIKERTKNKLTTTQDLVSCIEFLVPQKVKNQFLARVFQSIRIEVNQELNALVEFLNQLPKVLKNEGIVSIITYHSLEDRLVKNFFKTGNCKGDLKKDFFGNISKPFDLVNKKPIVPKDAEIKLNPRARSAKLRIAKKRK